MRGISRNFARNVMAERSLSGRMPRQLAKVFVLISVS